MNLTKKIKEIDESLDPLRLIVNIQGIKVGSLKDTHYKYVSVIKHPYPYYSTDSSGCFTDIDSMSEYLNGHISRYYSDLDSKLNPLVKLLKKTGLFKPRIKFGTIKFPKTDKETQIPRRRVLTKEEKSEMMNKLEYKVKY